MKWIAMKQDTNRLVYLVILLLWTINDYLFQWKNRKSN